MQKCEGKLTVFFENPFWVGVYERIADGKLEACKITFGAEPKDYEVLAFLLENWNSLHFSPSVEVDCRQEGKRNPKRMQRAIKKQLESQGVGTKAQQAMKLQQAEGKATRKKSSHLQRELEKERQFLLKQEKKKEKHKGH